MRSLHGEAARAVLWAMRVRQQCLMMTKTSVFLGMSCVDTTDAQTPHASTTTFRFKCQIAKHVSANADLLWLLHLCRHIFCKACLHETIKKLKKCPSEDLINLLSTRSH